MTAPLTAADHAFVAALSALSLMVVGSARDEAFYIDAANQVMDRISRNDIAMQKLLRAFVRLKASIGVLGESSSARFDLATTLSAFHRQRLARAFGAMEAAAGAVK